MAEGYQGAAPREKPLTAWSLIANIRYNHISVTSEARDKMKNFSSVIVVCIALGIFLAAADAAEDDPGPVVGNPAPTEPAPKLSFLGRLANGVRNIILCPLDIPFTVARHASETGNPVIGAVSGSLEGVVNGAVRLFAGTLEVVVSPVPGKRYPLYQRDLGERCIRERPAF